MIILPKNVADAIKYYREAGCTNSNIMARVLTTMYYDEPFGEDIYVWGNEGRNSTHRDMLMEALINGYEVEKTPQDIILDFYNEQTQAYMEANSWVAREVEAKVIKARLQGIKYALDVLGEKIEGIN